MWLNEFIISRFRIQYTSKVSHAFSNLIIGPNVDWCANICHPHHKCEWASDDDLPVLLYMLVSKSNWGTFGASVRWLIIMVEGERVGDWMDRRAHERNKTQKDHVAFDSHEIDDLQIVALCIAIWIFDFACSSDWLTVICSLGTRLVLVYTEKALIWLIDMLRKSSDCRMVIEMEIHWGNYLISVYLPRGSWTGRKEMTWWVGGFVGWSLIVLCW